MRDNQNIEDIITTAKDIVNKNDLTRFLDILFDYWVKEPPTLGHGFAHVVKVAVNSFSLGTMNGYDHPEQLFVGGLYHDIFRPARGQDGEEDQTHGAKIVAQLFKENNVDDELTHKVLAMIESHDNWRNQENPPMYDFFVSLGDKWAHDNHCFYTYMWSSNLYLEKQGKEPEFDSHLRVFSFFVKYQQRAWEIFYKYRNFIKGMDLPINSYLSSYQVFTENYHIDPNSDDFADLLKKYASEYKTMEKKVLNAFFKDKDKMEAVLSAGSSL